jgi:hypothetical protein
VQTTTSLPIGKYVANIYLQKEAFFFSRQGMLELARSSLIQDRRSALSQAGLHG